MVGHNLGGKGCLAFGCKPKDGRLLGGGRLLERVRYTMQYLEKSILFRISILIHKFDNNHVSLVDMFTAGLSLSKFIKNNMHA